MSAKPTQTVRIVRTDEAPTSSHDDGLFETDHPGDSASDVQTDAKTVAEAPATGAAAAAATQPETPSGKRKYIVIGAAVVALALAASYGSYYYLVGRFHVSTDDAYVRANNTTIGARVSGHIARFEVGDNSVVRAGDAVVRIDDGDYRIAADSARAKIATQQATIERIGKQASAQESIVEQAGAQLAAAKAAAQRAQADFGRQQALSDKGFASKAVFDTALATRDQADASVRSAQAAYDAAQANIDVVRAQQGEARRQLDELTTQLAKAQRDLDFTIIRAPVDGVFANRMVNTGDFVQPGQRIGNLVPLDAVYIDANFKETQLARLKPGQPAEITVDAYGGRTVHGVVDSLSPASGAVFSLLPPDNATGNFTKIVQRVPVRIRLPADVAKENLLRAGMSVVVTVDTKEAAAR